MKCCVCRSPDAQENVLILPEGGIWEGAPTCLHCDDWVTAGLLRMSDADEQKMLRAFQAQGMPPAMGLRLYFLTLARLGRGEVWVPRDHGVPARGGRPRSA